MSGEINVLSRTQIVVVEPTSGAVSVINAGPQGPSGSSTMAGPPGPPGADGTIILSGVGPPSPSLGSDGQYYVDTAGKALYGPRATVAASPQYVAFTDGGISVTSSSNEFGNRFLVVNAGVITGIRYKRTATTVATLTFNLWNVSPGTVGALLATTTDNRSGLAGWFTATFTTPVAVTAGQVITASMTASGGNVPIVAGSTLPGNPPSLTFQQSVFHVGPGYPSSATSGLYISPIWSSGGSTGSWPIITDTRYGVRILWENDSLALGSTTAEQTFAAFVLQNPVPGVPPGGRKWIFSTHGLCTNTAVSPINITLRVKINGTTTISTSTVSLPNGVDERVIEVVWELMGDNNWNLNQKARFRISGMMSPPNTTDDLLNRMGYARGTSIVEATWDEPILCEITAQMSSAATQTLDMHGYDVIYYATTPG